MEPARDSVGVVFVHGLFSSPKTWDALVTILDADDTLPFVSALRVDYASPKFRIRPDRRIPDFNDLAERMKTFLKVQAKNYDRLVLVAHSQGGLVVQRYLARMLSEGQGLELARIKGVVLFACPNDGSEFALSLRRSWWQRNPQERELRPFADQVKDAQRTVIRQIVHATELGPSTCPIPFWVYGGTEDNVVVRSSAQSAFPTVAMLPGDHNSIIQPTSHDGPVYLALREHLLEARSAPERESGPTPLASPFPVPTSAELSTFMPGWDAPRSNTSQLADYPVGDGAPAQQRAFHRIFNAAMTAGFGMDRAPGPVEQDGEVFVQYFERPSAYDNLALVVGPGEVSVALPADAWSAIRTVCGTRPSGGAALVGLPAVAALSEFSERIVDDEATEIELDGGSWGRGWLRRRNSVGHWSWEPAPSFALDQTVAATYWTAGPAKPYLRLRVLATFPWRNSAELAVTPERRRTLTGALPGSPLTAAFAALLAHRGSSLRAEEWRLGGNQNARDRASYVCSVNGPDGQPVLTAEVMLILRGGTLITCAEVRIDDEAAWRATLNETTDTRHNAQLSMEEVHAMLDSAWVVAGRLLPRAVTDDLEALLWVAPPKVELRLSTEAPAQQLLRDVIDLDGLGVTDHEYLQQMSVTITTIPGMNEVDRNGALTTALDWMYQSYGFVKED